MSKMPSEGRIIVEDIQSKNMFNKNCAKQNWYLNYTDGKTEVWDSNMAYTTEFIDVEPNMAYTMSCDISTIFNIYEYDENKNFIQYQQQNNDKNSFTITTSQNTKFIRMSCGKTRIEKMQFESGSKATEYSKHFDFEEREILKEITLGSLANADTIALTFNTTLKDTDTIKSYQLFAKNRTNQQLLTVPFLALNGTDYISAYLDNNQTITAKTNWNASSFDLILRVSIEEN